MTKPLTLPMEQIFQIHGSCVDSMLFSVLKKLSRFGFQMHLPYSEGLPGAIVSTGFILFLFSKMVTAPTNVVQVLQTGTKSPPAIRVVDMRMVL